MPIRAFVLAQVEPPRTKEVYGKLPRPLQCTMGRWDCAALVQAETPKMLAEQVIDQFRKTEGVLRTETLPVLTSSSKPNPVKFPINALMFLKTEAQKTNQVFGNLACLPEIQDVYTVAGRYDVIATIGANTWEDLSERLLNHVRTIDGITASETAIYA